MDSETWAKDIWEKASNNWNSRKQDKNYREYLVHPTLKRTLSQINVEKGVHADIGCGEGDETYFLKNLLKKKGFERFIGFDTNKNFVDTARKEYSEIEFYNSKDISLFVEENNLEGKVDLVTSLFVLQDSPQIWYLVEEQSRMLKEKGMSLNLIVFPQFAEALNEKGFLKLPTCVNRNRIDNYLFAAEYPIVEQEKEPFWVPYFHRNLSDYIQLIETYFYIDSVQSLKPSKELLRKSFDKNISPFCFEKNNVYWPEISEIPSSVIIKGIKK